MSRTVLDEREEAIIILVTNAGERWQMPIGMRVEHTDAGSTRVGHDRQHSNSPTKLAMRTPTWRKPWPGRFRG